MKNQGWMLCCLFLAGSPVQAGETLNLDGELVISQEPLTDPLPDGDTVAYMTLRGKDAQEVYEGIKGGEYRDACNTEGLTARVAGNLICYRNAGGEYLCSFGVRLTDGYLVLGRPC